MEKNCIYCNSLLDIKLHGLTKYCSTRCRNKDYYLKKKNELDHEKESEPAGPEELSEPLDSSCNQQNTFHSNRVGNTASNWQEVDAVRSNIQDKQAFPEVYKIILDEKGKNFELMSKINKLELQNEALVKENHELINENSLLEIEIENLDDSEEEGGGKIFGMPKSMIENIAVQILTPHAAKIISGLTEKKGPDHPIT